MADRTDAQVLQEWFFRFGYGRELPLSCPATAAAGSIPRHLKQAPGEIGSTIAATATDAESVDQLPRLFERDRKMFGIGQGNFRVTPLQVANAFATLARGGRCLPPRLFLSPQSAPATEPVDLPISPATLQVVYDGMSAVVNERGGTAYHAFAGSGLTQQGVTVYGKTGSTERPYHAWFAGFAEDQEGAKIASGRGRRGRSARRQRGRPPGPRDPETVRRGRLPRPRDRPGEVRLAAATVPIGRIRPCVLSDLWGQ